MLRVAVSNHILSHLGEVSVLRGMKGLAGPSLAMRRALKPNARTNPANMNAPRTYQMSWTSKTSSRWFCHACMKGFVIEGDGQPEACPEGHRE